MLARFLCVFTLVLCFSSPLWALPMQTSAKQAVIVDMGTGMTLLDKNADEQMPTSSMSKVMTAYMVFDALKEGKITMNTPFTVSEKAWRKGGSKMFVKVDSRVSVEDLLKGVIVQSGNDATIVLAEGLAGDEDSFAVAMTARARELGMKNSQFKNASGWPDPDHYSTARDLAMLGQRIIVDYPHYYSLYSMKEFEYNGIKQANRNPLLYRNMGVDGIKTGHTEVGGYGLMASGEKDGRRVVMVVNGLESERDRAEESARLMGWALNQFDNIDLVKQGAELAKAKTIFAAEDDIALTVGRDIRVTVPKLKKDDVTLTLNYKEPIQAPLNKGDVVGEAVVTIPDIGDFAVPLVLMNDLESAGFFGRTIDKFKTLLSGE
jgi:D-alanyl-D-alanine carboxypeptidase (penicillin-binding protein 5/6)